MDIKNVLVKKCDRYAIVTMNRPDSLNALSVALISELATTIGDLSSDPDIDVLILTGAGRAFCAGMDIGELKSGKIAAFLRDSGINLSDMIAAFPGPVIGAINGAAATGGFEMSAACDIILAGESARFVDTHSRIGLVPGWGLSQRLHQAIGLYRAKELAYTSRSLSAQEAYEWGLVNRVVPDEKLISSACVMAQAMAAGFPGILAQLKTQLNEGSKMSLGDALEYEKTFANEVMNALPPAGIRVGDVGRPGDKPTRRSAVSD